MREFSKNTTVTVVLLCVGLALTQPAASAGWRGSAPEQPVAFSHKTHAGDNTIHCLYCHENTDRSTVAGVPSLSVCVECHRGIKDTVEEFTPVQEAYDKGEPIGWVKVHDLPDHVHFTHKRHVRAGVGCQECHGDVGTMERIRVVQPLKMGWCLSCHTTSKVKLPEKGPAQFVRLEDNPHRQINMREVIRDNSERVVLPTIDCAGCHK